LFYIEDPRIFEIAHQPLAPPPLSSSSASPSATQQHDRWPSCHTARGPPASPSLHTSSPSLPTTLAPSYWPSPSVPRRSVARPSCHLAVAVASTPAAYKTLSFLAQELPELTLVLFHHFISAEQDHSPGSTIAARSSSPASSAHRGQPPPACPYSN
jgi:hypothetical protein